MRLFVDADACPVVPQCLEEAGQGPASPVTLVCDQAHRMERPGRGDRHRIPGGGTARTLPW